MSNSVTSLCRPVRVTPAQKAVLMCIADRADKGAYAYPSIESICEWTCLRRTAVIEAIKALSKSGILIVAKRKQNSNGYTIDQEVVALHGRPLGKLAEKSAKRTTSEEGVVRETDHQKSAKRTSPVRETDLSSPADGPKASISATEASAKKEKAPAAPWLTVDALVADGLTPETAAAYLDHRRAKKAKLTAFVWAHFREEVAKAPGWSIEDVVLKVITRGWGGFEAGWLQGDKFSTAAKHTGFAAKNYRKGVTADGSLA